MSVEIDDPRESPRRMLDLSYHDVPWHERESHTMDPTTAAKVAGNEIAKGDVLGCARIAGIQAAKRGPLTPS